MSDAIFRIKLYEDVANRVVERIRGGEWPAGAKLPTEQQMAVRFDVSRSTVREAVKSLQIAGILRSRAGSGTFVAERAPMILETRAMAEVMGDPEALRELVQARYVLEPQLAHLAALAATRGEAEGLLAIVTSMREKRERADLMNLGYRFHLELARAAHNRVLLGFYQSAASQLRSMRVLESLTLAVYREGVEQHQSIARAVREGDAPLAERRMRLHLAKDYAPYLDLHAAPADRPPP